MFYVEREGKEVLGSLKGNIINRIHQANRDQKGFELSHIEEISLRMEARDRRRERKNIFKTLIDASWKMMGYGMITMLFFPLIGEGLILTGFFVLMGTMYVHAALGFPEPKYTSVDEDYWSNSLEVRPSGFWSFWPYKIQKITATNLGESFWVSKSILDKTDDHKTLIPVSPEEKKEKETKTFFDEAIKKFSLFSSDESVKKSINALKNLDKLSEDEIEELRQDLNALLKGEKSKVIRHHCSLSQTAHKLLLYLTYKRPLNTECPIDLEAIADEKKILLSDGHQYNIHNLIEHFNIKGDFINPLTTDAKFNKYDIKHIKEQARLRALPLKVSHTNLQQRNFEWYRFHSPVPEQRASQREELLFDMRFR